MKVTQYVFNVNLYLQHQPLRTILPLVNHYPSPLGKLVKGLVRFNTTIHQYIILE